MGDSQCLKSGELNLQNKGILKTTWQKKFCLLYSKSEDCHPYLEFYEDKNAFQENKKKGKPCDKKIELQNVKSVQNSKEFNNKTTEFHIEIKCKSQKIALMFDNESEWKIWYEKLNAAVDISERGTSDGGSSFSGVGIDDDEDDDDNDEDDVVTLNQMYGGGNQAQAQRFSVVVESSDLAKLCNIEGDMTMLVTNQCITFEHPGSRQMRYNFQLCWMRRFGKKGSDQFYFECGRKCPNGEGQVTCQTKCAKEIHKLVSKKSSSRSETVIPHRKQEPAVDEHTRTSPVLQPRALPGMPASGSGSHITGPTLAMNKRRPHPGQANLPTLIPLSPETTSNGSATNEHNSPKSPLRNSAGKSFPLVKDDHSRSSGKKGQVTEIAKELEEKKLHGEFAKTESKKEKKEREKREKEEKKASEKKAKDEKKERERKEKEEKDRKEKEEKERKEKEKKKSKNVETDSGSQKRPSVKGSGKNAIYDEPDIDFENNATANTSGEVLYDEAIPDTAKTGHNKKSFKNTGGRIYDEPVTESAPARKSTSETVEYAEPYVRKGGIPVAEGVTYSEVKNVQRPAWKEQGREDKDIVFEEDYDNIKRVRGEIKAPPLLPERRYSQGESGGEEDEETYNTLDLNSGKIKQSRQQKPENLYGTASAKPIGPLVPDPPADYSDEEEEVEYNTVVDAAGYEDPQEMKLRTSQGKKAVVTENTYEEADPVPAKIPPPVAKKTNKPSKKKTTAPTPEALYEEVDQTRFSKM